MTLSYGRWDSHGQNFALVRDHGGKLDQCLSALVEDLETRGMLKVSAGDGSLASSVNTEADVGTAFALATSLYGNNLLQVSGNVGYGSQTGVPSARGAGSASVL